MPTLLLYSTSCNQLYLQGELSLVDNNYSDADISVYDAMNTATLSIWQLSFPIRFTLIDQNILTTSIIVVCLCRRDMKENEKIW